MLSDQPVIHKKMSAQEKENKRKIKRSKGGATMRRRKEEEEQKLRQKKGNSEIKEPLINILSILPSVQNYRIF